MSAHLRVVSPGYTSLVSDQEPVSDETVENGAKSLGWSRGSGGEGWALEKETRGVRQRKKSSSSEFSVAPLGTGNEVRGEKSFLTPTIHSLLCHGIC